MIIPEKSKNQKIKKSKNQKIKKIKVYKSKPQPNLNPALAASSDTRKI